MRNQVPDFWAKCSPNTKKEKQRLKANARGARKQLSSDLMSSSRVVTLAPDRPVVQRGRLPFGESMEVRLPYVENFAISCDGTTGLTTVGNTFYGNNMYDPRIGVGGHQPMQYDTLSTLFWRYRVHELECKITFSNPLYDGMWCGYRVRPNANTVATSGQTIDYIQEMSNAAIASINNTGSQTRTFRFRLNVPKFFGITEAQFGDQGFTGSFNGSITPGTWIIVEPYALHTVSGETSTIRCNIELIYHARCSDRLTVAQS